MKPRVISAISLLVLVSLSGFAKEPQRVRPGRPVTLEASGFELRTTLPHGWSFTTEEGFTPPPELVSSCRVRTRFHTEGNWDGLVVRELRSTDATLVGSNPRTVVKIAGHQAVPNYHRRKPFRVLDLYVDLSDLQPGSGMVWTFEGNPNWQGSDCEVQFLSMVNSATITRRP